MLPLHMEGQLLPTALDPSFERFYRFSLRQVVGSRLRARDLWDAYHAWAAVEGQRSLTFAALRQQMTLVGHRRVQSNGIRYLNVGLTTGFPDLADTLPMPFRGASLAPHAFVIAESGQLVAKIDAALQALLDLRRLFVAAEDAPHEMAARLLAPRA